MIWGRADVIIIIEIQCAINVMSLNHPKTIPLTWSMEKLSSMKLVPGDKKVRDRWGRASLEK